MKKLLSFLLPLFATASLAQGVGSTAPTSYWSGTYAKFLPSDGIYLGSGQSLAIEEDLTHYVSISSGSGSPSTTTWTMTLPIAHGTIGQVLSDGDGNGGLAWSDPGASTGYVNTALSQIGSKRIADLVCASNVTLSGAQTCDGSTTSSASIILAIAQTDPTENGLWLVDDFFGWTRPLSSTINYIPGSLINVDEIGGGVAYSNTLWIGLGDGATTASFRIVPQTAGSAQLTASSAIATDSSSHLVASSTTSTELGYVHNVTSAIQTQLNAKGTGSVTSVAASVPSVLSISGSPITTSGTLAIGYSGTALPIANGGTSGTTKSTAFDALSPMTTAGDIIYGGTSGTGTRLAPNGAGTVTLHGGSTPSWAAVTLSSDVTGILPTTNGGTGANAASANAAFNALAPTQTSNSGKFLTTNGTDTSWSSAALTNPMTTTGDIIYSSNGSGTPARLAIGASTTVLHGGTTPSYSSIVNADVDAAAAIAGSKLVAAASGVAGAVSTGTQTMTGAKTFETQLIGKGTATNDAAAAGYIGEYFENNRASAMPNITSNVYFSLDTSCTTFAGCSGGAGSPQETGITLTAGDWDISGHAQFQTTGAVLISETDLYIGTGTGTNVSTGVDTSKAGSELLLTYTAGADPSVDTGTYRVSLSGTTTYYLKARCVFASGTSTSAIGNLRARRIR